MRMDVADLSGNGRYGVTIGDPKTVHNRTVLDESVVVFSNASPNAASRTYEMFGGNYVWNAVASNFNSATITLQVLGPDGVYQSLGAGKTASDATGGTSFSLGFDSFIRINVSGGTPANLYVTIQKV